MPNVKTQCLICLLSQHSANIHFYFYYFYYLKSIFYEQYITMITITLSFLNTLQPVSLCPVRTVGVIISISYMGNCSMSGQQHVIYSQSISQPQTPVKGEKKVICGKLMISCELLSYCLSFLISLMFNIQTFAFLNLNMDRFNIHCRKKSVNIKVPQIQVNYSDSLQQRFDQNPKQTIQIRYETILSPVVRYFSH